jgi:hypothetical protein
MPVIENIDSYNNFVQKRSTMFVFNSTSYLIWKNKTELNMPVLKTTSIHHDHKGMNTSRKLFGFPIKFVDASAHQYEFEVF